MGEINYINFIKEFSFKYYCKSKDMDYDEFMNKIVDGSSIDCFVEFIGTRNLAIEFADNLRSAFERNDLIDEEIVIDYKTIEEELNSYLDDILFDYLQDFKNEVYEECEYLQEIIEDESEEYEETNIG